METLVCYLTYNRLSFTQRTFPRLVQTVPDETRLVVVDNGSTDGTADWLQKNYEHIQLIRMRHNLGMVGGYNIGLRERRPNEAFVRCNNDAFIERNGWLQNLVQWAEVLPDVGLIAHLFRDNRHGGTSERGRIKSLDLYEDGAAWLKVRNITAPINLLTPAAIETIGAFWCPAEFSGTWFPTSKDLGRRLARAGLNHYYVSTDHIWHTHIESQQNRHNSDPEFWKPRFRALIARRKQYRNGEPIFYPLEEALHEAGIP